jgi:hypothetical protein
MKRIAGAGFLTTANSFGDKIEMTKLNRFLALFLTLMVSSVSLAQDRPADPAAGCAACGGCGFIVVVIVGLIALNIFLLVWVARDAKARGMDNAVLWMLLVLFFGLLGLLIYILSRTQGNLIQCPHCQGKRLEASAKCPQCGNA